MGWESESDRLTPTPDGREQSSRLIGYEDDQRIGSRFFQAFEECIGGLQIHLFGRMDERDLVSPAAGGLRRPVGQLPDLIYLDLL